ncbi:helix-turn-helix transcriptional regulator [Achromobacter ruhlandii]|uniref:helix-turn-helix transcriptional regulator n=2 Tax=Achromobacter ruhlandii TaxID=72557 RepID=UPI0009BA3B19
MHPKTLICLRQAMEISGHRSRSAFYRRLQTDSSFPKPVKLGRSTRFVLQELLDWIDGQMRGRL